MQVKDLIKELNKFDPEAILVTEIDNFKEDNKSSLVEIEGVRDIDYLPGDQKYYSKFKEYWEDNSCTFKPNDNTIKLIAIDI